MKPSISIIIPAYNCKQFIWRCIKSVTLDQDIDQNKIEILIINDFSTDGSSEVIKKIKNSFLNIRVFQNMKNQGVSYSRNKGIKNAKGNYIIFLDSDDYLKKNCLKSILREIINKKKPDVVFGRFKKDTFPYNNDVLIKNYNYSMLNKNFFFKKIIDSKFPLDECWPYIVKREFLLKNKINFLNVRVAEDQLYVLKLLSSMKTFSVYKKNFYVHQNLGGTLSDFMDLKSTFCCLKVILEYIYLITSKKISSNFYLTKLANIYLQSLFSMFTALLIMRNNKEILSLSRMFSNFKKIDFNLIKYPENVNLGLLIKTHDSFKALLYYKKKIMRLKYIKIEKFIKKKTNLYFYCYSKFLGASKMIMGNSWSKVKLILDENVNLKNKVFGTKRIVHPDLITFRKRDRIVINSQRDITIKKIFNSLVSRKIKKNNILILRY